MKKNKLFVLSALMVLLLGSCGYNNQVFMNEEQIKEGKFAYANEVDYKNFSSFEPKLLKVNIRRMVEDHFVKYDYYLKSEYDNPSDSGMSYSEKYFQSKGECSRFKEYAEYEETIKEESDSNENQETCNIYKKNLVFMPTESDAVAYITLYENGKQVELEYPNCHFINWEQAVNHFVFVNSLMPINEYHFDVLGYSKDSKYYVDDNLYTKVSDNSIYQLLIEEQLVAIHIESDFYDSETNAKNHYVGHYVMEYRDIND